MDRKLVNRKQSSSEMFYGQDGYVERSFSGVGTALLNLFETGCTGHMLQICRHL